MNRIFLWLLVVLGSAFGGWMASDWRQTPIFAVCALLFLLLGAAVSAYLSVTSYGLRTALKTLAILSVFAYLIEGIGVNTGFPYGSFVYLDGLGPLLVGVPLLLPLAWVPLMLAAWQIAARVTNNVASTIFLSAWILLAIDLVLDPGAVALGLWKYQAGGMYHDVPWTNFMGWILSSSLGAWLTTSSLRITKGSLFYWCLAFVSGLGFWSAVSFRVGYMTPACIGGLLLIGVSIFVWRDENTRIC
ncbi:carotenoid biosynthesis protein [Patescibacteria group bacterium]|nr:carotenoid biosynthesis protein [Patescibacteria group bacterium]MBP9710441.1 carotenoid biosynthesis protein [Patescibacteria group bacterium]